MVSEDRRRFTWYKKSRSSVVSMSIDGRYWASTRRQSSRRGTGCIRIAPKASLWIGGRNSRASHLTASATKDGIAGGNSGSTGAAGRCAANSCLMSSLFSSATMSKGAPSNVPRSCTTPVRGSSDILSGGVPVIAFHQSRANTVGLPESENTVRRNCSVRQGEAGRVVSTATNQTPYENERSMSSCPDVLVQLKW